MSETKDFLVVDDNGKPEIWIREKYEKYVRSVLGLGACPAVRVITEFNFDESLFTEIKELSFSQALNKEAIKEIERLKNEVAGLRKTIQEFKTEEYPAKAALTNRQQDGWSDAFKIL